MDSALTKHQTLWQTCLYQVKQFTSEEVFTRLFKPLEVLSFDSNILRLRVPSKQHLMQIEQNYIKMLAPIIKSQFGSNASVRYAIPNESPVTDATARGYESTTDTRVIKNPFIIPGIKRVKFDSQLLPHYNFDNFVEGDCNRLVRSAGISVSVDPGVTSFNPLFIYGSSGLGKTHVAQAIGNTITQRHPNLKVLYVSANRFQAQFQYASHHGEVSDFIQFYQLVDVLIVDDIQEFSGNKPGTQNVFFNIFNQLHMLGKQVILTSDRPPVELKDIDDRLLTRFKWGLSAMLDLPDFETKVAILKSKAEGLGVVVPGEVIEFIANNIKANVRELEGALTSLKAHSNLMNKAITIDLARSVMRDIVTIKNVDINIETILEEVSNYYKVDLESLLSNSRKREIVVPRQVAMYLCKLHTKCSLGEIGKGIGNKNHATVLYACNTIANLMDTDKILKHQIEEIERKMK